MREGGRRLLAWPAAVVTVMTMTIALSLMTPVACDSAPLVETNLKLVEDFVVAFEIRSTVEIIQFNVDFDIPPVVFASLGSIEAASVIAENDFIFTTTDTAELLVQGFQSTSSLPPLGNFTELFRLNFDFTFNIANFQLCFNPPPSTNFATVGFVSVPTVVSPSNCIQFPDNPEVDATVDIDFFGTVIVTKVRSVEFPIQGFQFVLEDVMIDNPSQNANPLFDATGVNFQQSGVLGQDDGFTVLGFPIASDGFIPNSEELLPFFEINVGAKGTGTIVCFTTDPTESLLTVGSVVGDALSVPIDFSNEENGPCLGPLEDLLSLELKIADTSRVSVLYRSTTLSPDAISFSYNVSGVGSVVGVISDEFIPNTYAPSNPNPLGLSNSVGFLRSPGQPALDVTDGSPEEIFFIILLEGDQSLDGATVCLTSIEISDASGDLNAQIFPDRECVTFSVPDDEPSSSPSPPPPPSQPVEITLSNGGPGSFDINVVLNTNVFLNIFEIDFDVTPVLTGVTFPFSSPVIGSSNLTEQGFILTQNTEELSFSFFTFSDVNNLPPSKDLLVLTLTFPEEAERSEICVNPQGNTFFQSPPIPPSNSPILQTPTFGFGGPCVSLICAGQGDLNRDQIVDIGDLVVLVDQVLLDIEFDPLSCFVINGNLANPLVNNVDVGDVILLAGIILMSSPPSPL